MAAPALLRNVQRATRQFSPCASKSMPPWSGEPESGWFRKWQPRMTKPSFPASMTPIVPAAACQPEASKTQSVIHERLAVL